MSSYDTLWVSMTYLPQFVRICPKGGRNKWSDGEFCVVVILNSSPSGLKFSTTTKQNSTSDHGVLLLWSDGEFCVVVIYNFSPEGLELKNVTTQNSPTDHLFLPPFNRLVNLVNLDNLDNLDNLVKKNFEFFFVWGKFLHLVPTDCCQWGESDYVCGKGWGRSVDNRTNQNFWFLVKSYPNLI